MLNFGGVTIGFPYGRLLNPYFCGGYVAGGVGWLAMKFTITTQVIESNKNTNTPTQKKNEEKTSCLTDFGFRRKIVQHNPSMYLPQKPCIWIISIWCQQNYTKFSLNHALTQNHWRFFQLRFAVHLLVTPPKKKSLYYQPKRYAVNFGKSPPKSPCICINFDSPNRWYLMTPAILISLSKWNN